MQQDRRPRQDELLRVTGLKKYFPIRKGFGKKITAMVKAVDDVSFGIFKGETLGLVGESGCGKTTTARLIMQAYLPTAGRIELRRSSGEMQNLAELDARGLHELRRELQMVFQDPYSSLNPRMTVRELLSEPLAIHRIGTKSERERRVEEMLELIGLQPEYMNRYPHAFSGGQRQRLGIARAIIMNPSLIVCDEPVSALDVSVQAQILNLLQDLQDKLGLTYLFIAHDLSVVRHICDRVAVMYVGKIVELADTESLFTAPLHPYTEALLSAVPASSPDLKKDRILLRGEVADPASPPRGCYFHPRCLYVQEKCRTEEPKLRVLKGKPGRFTKCHRADELELRGVPSFSEVSLA
ncbi:MAG: dipeptide ABC transporter ATP-binding protein [Firmicutes bacterium]|nr:dipeptide ABC transporter ATP-binding protein [Bacillota bacterium]